MKNATTPPIGLWWPLAQEYATTNNANVCDGLVYIGRGTDRADVTTNTPGETYSVLVEFEPGYWRWEERTIEADPDESTYDAWDAGCDRYHSRKDDNCYA